MSAQPVQSTNTNAQSGPAPVTAFLQKKGLLGAGRGLVVSPTDNVLSPCSAKLSGAKQRHFQKAKPFSLASQLSKLAVTDLNGSISSAAGEKPKIDF